MRLRHLLRGLTTDLEVRTLPLGPFQANCYLVRAGDTVVVIDPGAEPEAITAAARDLGNEAAALLLTHAHVDHVGAVAELRARWQAPVYLHPDDLPLYERAPEHAALFGLQMERPPPPDRELEAGRPLRIGELEFEVRHAPGHSPGGVVFVTPDRAFVGDCVFAGSIGRTDLPGGDHATLLRSIREHILTLPPETVLHPGHGPATTVQREARENPFLAGAG